MGHLEELQRDNAEKLEYSEESECFKAHQEGFKFAVFLVNQILSDTLAADGPVACMEAAAEVYQELLSWSDQQEEASNVN